MRSILVLLVLINLALFAWWQGWLGGWSDRSAAVPAELHPERLRVVPIDRLGGPPARSVPPASDPRQGQQVERIRSSSDVVDRSKRNGIE